MSFDQNTEVFKGGFEHLRTQSQESPDEFRWWLEPFPKILATWDSHQFNRGYMGLVLKCQKSWHESTYQLGFA